MQQPSLSGPQRLGLRAPVLGRPDHRRAQHRHFVLHGKARMGFVVPICGLVLLGADIVVMAVSFRT